MAFDLGGWMSGAGSAVDRFLGGTGGEPIPANTPMTTTDEYAIPQTSVETYAPEAAIPDNYTVVSGGADQSGEYKPTTMDTSAPSTQSFVESYVQPTQEIDRLDYTKIADIGDSKTQDLIKQGYSAEQATALQRDEAKEAGNTRAALYYQNEYDKALQSKVALSSEYHHEALDSGLPQAINPFEHTGDLAKMALGRSQGVSNVSGTGLIPQFKGSLLEDANIVTRSARTGDLGDYKYLGKPYSSTYGVLSLGDQQAIGRAAATSKYNPYGWEVKEDAMSKFTPELAKSSGFDLFYKPANLGEARKLTSPTGEKLLSPDYMGSIVQGDKMVIGVGGKPVITKGAVIQIGGSPTNEIVGGAVSAVMKGSKEGVVGKSTEEINEFLLPEDVVHGKSDYKVDLPGASVSQTSAGVVSASRFAKGVNVASPLIEVTGASKTVKMTEAPPGNWLNRYTGGMSGGDVSVSGLDTKTFLIPLKTPENSAMARGNFGLAVAGTQFRKSKRSSPVIRRESKPDKKSKPYGMMTVEDHSILRTIGNDFFKFKVGSPTGAIKTKRDYIDPIVSIRPNASLKKTVKTTVVLPKITMPKGKMNNMVIDVSGIISTASKRISKRSK